MLTDDVEAVIRELFAKPAAVAVHFTHLRETSQTEHRKLADVAQQIVDEAVRRARARHKPTE
jgi:hypothetical protein